MVTPRSFRQWLRDAEPGDRLCYHTGHLSEDRTSDGQLEALAQQVATAAEAGFVELVQQKHFDQRYGYYVTRTAEIDG